MLDPLYISLPVMDLVDYLKAGLGIAKTFDLCTEKKTSNLLPMPKNNVYENHTSVKKTLRCIISSIS